MIAASVALALVVASGVRPRGQDPGDARTVLYPYPLSAIDRGVMSDRGPGPARSRSSRGAYAPGRVIVKFRDGTSSAVRLNSLARVSAASTRSERPSYANFDVVSIDPAEDAEAAADALRQRPEVEYAQPAYRVHKMFVPNDAFYRQLQ